MAGEERKWCGEARRILKIGRAVTDTVKTGVWEAGVWGTAKSEKVKRLESLFDEAVRIRNVVAKEIDELPDPFVGDLPSRVSALDAALEELQTREVMNDDEARDAFIEDVEGQIAAAERLSDEVDETRKRAAARKPHTITYAVPDGLRPGEPISPETLGASIVGEGSLTLYHKSQPVGSAILNAGNGQKIELHATESRTHLAAVEVLRVDVRASPRVITWTPPEEVQWGGTVTIASLGASATGDGGPLALDDRELQTVGEGRRLVVTAPGSKAWSAATAEAFVRVTKADRDVDWTPPSQVIYGTKITLDLLQAKSSLGDGRLTLTKPSKGKFAGAGAGQQVEVHLAETEFYVGVTKTALVDVEPITPQIHWKEPASIIAGDKLSSAQLCAKVDPDGLSKLVYEPASGTEMASAGTFYLRATLDKTKNNYRARRDVRLRVHANADTQRGYESMRDGSAWSRPTTGTAKVRLNEWESDDGSNPDGIKTQGQRIMSEISRMTSDELVAHLDTLCPAASDKFVDRPSKTYPSTIWKFPNGLQVRYKPNGDPRNIAVPMFCIEARTTAGFSEDQGAVAFKISADGVPSAKGPAPSDTIRPADLVGEAAEEAFVNGACQSTHLKCRPKQEQVIVWHDPAPIPVGTPLSEAQLNATLKEGDGVLTYDPAKGRTLDQGDRHALRVVASATARYKQAEHTVHIDVKSV